MAFEDRQYKFCGVCQRYLLVTRFPVLRDRRNPKPYRYYRCYDCHRAKNLEYYKANKERMNAQNKVYWGARKAIKAKYNRRYRRLFTEYKRKAKDMQPRLQPTPPPSPEQWQEAAEQSQQRILANHG